MNLVALCVLVLVFVASLGGERPARVEVLGPDLVDAVPAPSSSAADPPGARLAEAPAIAPPAPSCAHLPPFTMAGPDEELAPGPRLPTPFEAFTACDALAALFPDYDPIEGTSLLAKGPARVDRVRRWEVAGRALLAATYYVGEEATELCGSCRVAARLAVFERRGPRLALLARAPELWKPGADVFLADGRAEFDEVSYEVAEGAPLLGIRTRWTCGMIGSWQQLSLYRLDGRRLSKVLDEQVDWFANGMGGDDDEVSSTLAPEGQGRALSDLRMTTEERRCRLVVEVQDNRTVCDPPAARGSSRLRFDGKAYRRVEGKAPRLPGILRRLPDK